jgi:hypothetical protein
MIWTSARVVGAFALLLVLALPAPAVAGELGGDGIANAEQMTAFSSAQRRASRARHYSARYGAAPCYYPAFRRCGYACYNRPYLCYGAPYEVPLYIRARY